jgi:hypothetical protein
MNLPASTEITIYSFGYKLNTNHNKRFTQIYFFTLPAMREGMAHVAKQCEGVPNFEIEIMEPDSATLQGIARNATKSLDCENGFIFKTNS